MRKQDRDAQRLADAYKQKAMDYQITFGTDSGKRVLEDLSRECFETRTTYADNPHKTSHNEGLRRVIIYIRSMLRRDPHEVKQEIVKD